jgi:hypothetical protein
MGPLAALVGLATALGYLLCAGPTFYWLDSSEFVAAAWGLGVSHPPGHPLPSLLGRLFCLLPVGSLSFRVSLASAVEAGAACSLMVLLAHEVLARVGLRGRVARWARPLGAATAGLALGLSYALWFQAVRAEVYALNLLLLVAGALLVLRWDRTRDRRFLLAAGLVGGLALCNHHFLVLLALLPLTLFVVLRRARPALRRLVVGLPLVGALGLATLAYLPLRASQVPVANWGSPSTLERFASVVSARAFHSALDRAARESLGHRTTGGILTVFRGVAWDSALGPALALLMLAGIYLLLRRRATLRVGLLLLGLAVVNLVSPVLVGLDPFNPDAYGYLCVALAFLCPGLAVLWAVACQVLAGERIEMQPRQGSAAAACGVPAGVSRPPVRLARRFEARLAAGLLRETSRPNASRAVREDEALPRRHQSPSSRRSRVVLAGAALLSAGLVLGQLRANLPKADLRHHWAAEESGRQLLAGLPPDALLFAVYFETVFNLWALKVTADVRPDVDVVSRGLLGAPGYIEDLAVWLPEVHRAAVRWRAAGKLQNAELARLAGRRPVYLEYDEDLPPEVVQRLRPAGLAQAWARAPAAVDEQAHLAAVRRWHRLVGLEATEWETRRAMLWTHYQLALLSCRRNLPNLARYHLARAREIAPLDRRLRKLARWCGTVLWPKSRGL